MSDAAPNSSNCSGIRRSLSSLLALQTEYTASVNKIRTQSVSTSATLTDELSSHQIHTENLSSAIKDTQMFLDLIDIIDGLEADKLQWLVEKQTLVSDNRGLTEDLEMLQKKLALSEEKVIQLEIDKQDLEFSNQLYVQDKEITDSRLSEARPKYDSEKRLDEPSSDTYRSPAGGKIDFLRGHADSSSKSVERNFRARNEGVSRGSEERSPWGKMPSGKSGGNLTMFMGDGMAVDELEELTDKLNWYESIIHQLQGIFGTEMDDLDVTYHEESNKVVERAKRMIEYQAIVRDYEKEIGENRTTMDRLRKERNELRKQMTCDRALSNTLEPTGPQFSLPSATIRRKNSR